RDGLAVLRHDLHGALHAHPAGEPRRLRRERAARLRRQPEGELPPRARHRGRQRPLPEQRPPRGAARGGEQAVRHAHLPEQDPRHRRGQHAGEPLRAAHAVAEEQPVARAALAVLTLINLFNYLDRWIVAALAESMKHSELQLSDTQLGWLMTGFIVVYMLAAPLFGSRQAFFVAGIPGLALAALALRLYDPPRGAQDPDAPAAARSHTMGLGTAARAAYALLLRNRPYVLTVLGYAAYTFAIGALAFWTPSFLERARGIPKAQATVQFGAIVVVTGFIGTYAGGWIGDYFLRVSRQAYLWVSGVVTLLAVPLTLVALAAQQAAVYWPAIVAAELCLFASTGPINSAIVNVVSPHMRATAVALSIFTIHLLGDVPSPSLVGALSDARSL